MKTLIVSLAAFLATTTILLPLATPIARAQGFNAKQSSQQSKSTKKASSKNKSKKSKASAKTTASEPRSNHKRMAIGVGLGWESTYGNGLTYHYYPWRWLDLNGGLGYNRSGLKVGGGGAVLWRIFGGFGLRTGLALVYSAGGSGEVEIDGTFTPDNSSKSEEITASKTYDVASAMLLNTYGGAFFDLASYAQVFFEFTYNAVLSGNEVTFDDDIKYSRTIEASNPIAAEQQFEKEAEDTAQSGGPGFNIGMRFLF